MLRLHGKLILIRLKYLPKEVYSMSNAAARNLFVFGRINDDDVWLGQPCVCQN